MIRNTIEYFKKMPFKTNSTFKNATICNTNYILMQKPKEKMSRFWKVQFKQQTLFHLHSLQVVLTTFFIAKFSNNIFFCVM